MGTEMPVDPVGRLVAIDQERATVRYIGPVAPTTGVWIGVEWDDPERGKHDGSHEGVQYFTCRHPKGGSFVRPVKASFGVDFLTALRQVYQVDTEDVLTDEVVSSSKLNWSEVKEFRFDQLSCVALDHYKVNGPGAPGEIRNTTPNIQWLNVSKSLMTCWEDVASITKQLDNLEELNLSNNRLRLPSDPSAHCQAFSSLKCLILNSCELTWQQILECAPMWPQLERLFVENNNVTELQRPEGVLQTLRHLNLSHNPVVQDSLLSLSALPRLELLILSSTGLSAIRFEDAAPGHHTAMFPALKELIVNHNNITEWSVINELGKLPCLVKFSCRGNRLVSSDGNPNTANQMIIAKLGKLETLNNCEIKSSERRGAELDYIKMFGEEWLKAGGPGQPSLQFVSQHPSYQKLIHKYGAPEEGELKKHGPTLLKNQLLKVTFVFPDDAGQKPIEKKLPASMNVQKIKGLLHRLLKVPPADLRLTYSSPKHSLGTEVDINNDLRPLGFFSIEDGDQVLVRWS